MEDSINPTRAFCTVKVILEVDHIYKRMRIEIFEEGGAKKLGSGFGKFIDLFIFLE